MFKILHQYQCCVLVFCTYIYLTCFYDYCGRNAFLYIMSYIVSNYLGVCYLHFMHILCSHKFSININVVYMCFAHINTCFYVNPGRNTFCSVTQGRDGHIVFCEWWKSCDCLFFVHRGIVLNFFSRREQRCKAEVCVVAVIWYNPAEGHWCYVIWDHFQLNRNTAVCDWGKEMGEGWTLFFAI